MLVLHTHFQPALTPTDSGAVLFWAEISEGSAPAWQRGRISANPRPKDHPFCAPLLAVQALLDRTGDEMSIILRLPTTRTGPLPSPGLIHNWELDAETPPFLAPWTVKGLRLPLEEAIPLLVDLPEVDAENNQFTLGSDAIFWSRAATLVLETLAAQKLVPILTPADQVGKVGFAHSQGKNQPGILFHHGQA